jgi:hypothetical protein
MQMTRIQQTSRIFVVRGDPSKDLRILGLDKDGVGPRRGKLMRLSDAKIQEHQTTDREKCDLETWIRIEQ